PEPAAVVAEPPRTEVQFVDRDRLVESLARAARGHPLAVAPVVAHVRDDRRGLRRCLGFERERVGLVDAVPAARLDVELVAIADGPTVEQTGPDTGAL